MNTTQQNGQQDRVSKKKAYESPSVEVSYITQEYGLAASSIRRDNIDPIIAEWEEVETESIWNF